jgi:hypothetical protein
LETAPSAGTERQKDLKERAMWREFSKAVREVWHASGEPTSAYRPDLHYMRGPGPKWHAKYGSLAPKAPQTSPARPALREAVQHRA